MDDKIQWQILWHQDSDKSLPEKFNILEDGKPWLIVTDDADRIAEKIYERLKSLSESGRYNVHFLLCCRDTDWKAVNADAYRWNLYGKRIEKKL